MDAGDLIASAFFEGADACRGHLVPSAVKDAYEDLRLLMAGALPQHQHLLNLAETGMQAEAAPLAEALRATGAAAREDVLEAAQRLRGLLRSSGTGEASAEQVLATPADRGPDRVDRRLPTVSGYRLPTSSGLDQAGRIVSGPGQLSPDTSLLFSLADHIAYRGPSGSGQAGQDYHPHAYGLVILVEGCSGIQVGDGNDQLSVYQVTLPAAVLASARELAELLLAADTPWAQDVFGHDAELPSLAPRGGPDPDSRRIVHRRGGDALVIEGYSGRPIEM